MANLSANGNPLLQSKTPMEFAFGLITLDPKRFYRAKMKEEVSAPFRMVSPALSVRKDSLMLTSTCRSPQLSFRSRRNASLTDLNPSLRPANQGSKLPTSTSMAHRRHARPASSLRPALLASAALQQRHIKTIAQPRFKASSKTCSSDLPNPTPRQRQARAD